MIKREEAIDRLLNLLRDVGVPEPEHLVAARFEAGADFPVEVDRVVSKPDVQGRREIVTESYSIAAPPGRPPS